MLLDHVKLDPAEDLARLIEETDALTAKNNIEGQAELTKQERAWGPRMNYRELITRIQKVDPKIRVVDGSSGQVAVYRLKTRLELAENVEMPSNFFAWYKDFAYVTGFPKDYLPEYGYILEDERGRAHREVRGWRSVLMALIKSRALQYKDVIEEFGEVRDSRGNRWCEQLRQYR